MNVYIHSIIVNLMVSYNRASCLAGVLRKIRANVTWSICIFQQPVGIQLFRNSFGWETFKGYHPYYCTITVSLNDRIIRQLEICQDFWGVIYIDVRRCLKRRYWFSHLHFTISGENAIYRFSKYSLDWWPFLPNAFGSYI